MKNLKNQKGITLVALVVTIIVLLILAGVSLSLVSGSNGIMSRAGKAVTTAQIANAKEEGELAVMTSITAYYEARYAAATKTTKTLPEYVADDLTTNVPSLSGDASLTAAYDSTAKTSTITLTVGGKTYTATLDEDGKLSTWAETTAAGSESGSNTVNNAVSNEIGS